MMYREGGGDNQGRWQLGEHQQPWWALCVAWQAAESWAITATGVQEVDTITQWLRIWTSESDRSVLKPQMSFRPAYMRCPDVTNGACLIVNSYFIPSKNIIKDLSLTGTVEDMAVSKANKFLLLLDDVQRLNSLCAGILVS